MAITITTPNGGLAGHGVMLPGHRLLTVIGAAAQRLSSRLILWHERAYERRQLLGLSDAALKDFGASRADGACEGDKPFWRG
jgi:uncharacterized protein YjiS (DUF1127 family)